MTIPYSKIAKRYAKIAVLFVFIIACSKSGKKKNSLKKYKRDDHLLVKKVLQNVSPEMHKFLLFPRDLCRTCFRNIIEHFERRKTKGHVVLLGANDYEIKRLNAIYHNSLKFLKGTFKDYGALWAEYPKMMRGYVRYVEIDTDTLIYKGKGANKTERVRDVLKYFVKRDKDG